MQLLAGPGRAARRRGTTFRFAGRAFPYCRGRQSWNWLNERAVEVPIGEAAVREAPGPRILEVGNVLGHYASTTHDVVDRYERGTGLRNVDVFDVDGSYDLIVSISTIEHIGWDERPVDPDRAAAAVRHLQSCVADGGSTLITVPVGYHPELDRAIVAGALAFDDVRALGCAYPAAVWSEVDPRAVLNTARYDRLLYRADAVLVCRWWRDRTR